MCEKTRIDRSKVAMVWEAKTQLIVGKDGDTYYIYNLNETMNHDIHHVVLLSSLLEVEEFFLEWFE